MKPSILPVPRQARAAWLLACGLFAIAMTAMGGVGLMRTHAAGGGFLVEICSAKGAGRIEFVSQSGERSLPGGSHSDCCQLCATGAPLLLADATLVVPTAPVLGDTLSADPVSRPAASARLSHAPRGPPSA
jgi:hypothetical protein